MGLENQWAAFPGEEDRAIDGMEELGLDIYRPSERRKRIWNGS
jgi:hypothetical protein